MSPEETKRQNQFELLNLGVSKALYRLLANNETPVTPGPQPKILNLVLHVAAAVKQSQEQGAAFLTLDFKIVPDPQWQPYEIEVTIGAAFRSADATPDELLNFCRLGGPSILFPYVREYVHRLTMDAPHGPVKLNPMNIAQMLNQTEWEVSQTEPVVTSPSEPTPPSER